MLDFEDRHAAYCAGLHDGEARRVDLAIEDEVQARLHALARPIVLAMVEDLNRIDKRFRSSDEQRRAHQIEACQAYQANARAWPAEDPNPSARVLNGWPDRWAS